MIEVLGFNAHKIKDIMFVWYLIIYILRRHGDFS